jgi:hypothetical protein
MVNSPCVKSLETKWRTKLLLDIVWSTLYGPLGLASSLCVSNAFSLSIVQEGNHTISFSGFLICDFHLLNVFNFVPISKQMNIKEHVPVECETSEATSQGRMYCCFNGMHSDG